MIYDLFVSYARKDNIPVKDGALGFVTAFIEALRKEHRRFTAEPLRIFFDKDDIRGGDDWELKIEASLRNAKLMIVCLSPNYFRSDWCLREWQGYIRQEADRAVAGEGINPVYFVEVPGYESGNVDTRIAAWVHDLNRRNHTDLRPWWPEGVYALQKDDVHRRLETLDSQIESRLDRITRALESPGSVDRPAQVFVGRKNELRSLRHILTGRGKVGVITAVHGLGGIGKSALANQYAHAFAGEYPGGRWMIRCEGLEDLPLALMQLVVPLQIELDDVEKKNPDLAARKILSHLEQQTMKCRSDKTPNPACLLIMDNIDRPILLSPAQTATLPKAEWLHIIATTRLGSDQLYEKHHDRHFLALDELPEGEALLLLMRYQPEEQFTSDRERDAARQIVQSLGGFALAVELVAVYLGLHPEIRFSSFLGRLMAEGIDVPESIAGEEEVARYVLHREKSLSAVFRPMLNSLSDEERCAVEIAALLPADSVPLPWIAEIMEQTFQHIREVKPGYPVRWEQIVRRLRGKRLLQETSDLDEQHKSRIVKMHRLLQEEVVKHRSNTLGDLEGAIIDLAFRRAELMNTRWYTSENQWEINPLVSFCSQLLMKKNPRSPRLLICLSEWLLLYEYSPRVESLQLASLRFLEEMGDKGSTDLATTLSNAGAVMMYQGKYDAAEPFLRRSLELETHNRTPDHPVLAVSMSNLATLYVNKRRYEDAEPLLRSALSIVRQTLGPAHPETATVCNNLGSILYETRRHEEAEMLLRTALEIRETTLENKHPLVALSLNNLGSLLRDTGRIGEAELLYRKSLQLERESRGDGHAKVAARLLSLAIVLIMQDNVIEARRNLAEAWRIKDQKHDITSGRIAVTGLVVAFLDQSPHQQYTARLKTLLSMLPLPDFADVAKVWNVDPFLGVLRSRLSRPEHDFISALVRVLNDVGEVGALDNYEYWRNTPGCPLEQPWPEETDS